MTAGRLSWGAQVAAHAAYIEAHAIAAPPAGPSAPVRHSRARAARNREALLHALRDGKPHRFADLRAALPGLSVQGVYYLVNAMKEEGRIGWPDVAHAPRLYTLT